MASILRVSARVFPLRTGIPCPYPVFFQKVRAFAAGSVESPEDESVEARKKRLQELRTKLVHDPSLQDDIIDGHLGMGPMSDSQPIPKANLSFLQSAKQDLADLRNTQREHYVNDEDAIGKTSHGSISRLSSKLDGVHFENVISKLRDESRSGTSRRGSERDVASLLAAADQYRANNRTDAKQQRIERMKEEQEVQAGFPARDSSARDRVAAYLAPEDDEEVEMLRKFREQKQAKAAGTAVPTETTTTLWDRLKKAVKG